MKKSYILLILATAYVVSGDNNDKPFSMQNDALSQEIEASYVDWKNTNKITPDMVLNLKYNLSIIGPDLSGNYTIDGSTMLKMKNFFDKVRRLQEPNQWYAAQIDSIYDSNYGIEEHTVAITALTLNQMREIVQLVPALKIDFDKTLNGNES